MEVKLVTITLKSNTSQYQTIQDTWPYWQIPVSSRYRSKRATMTNSPEHGTSILLQPATSSPKNGMQDCKSGTWKDFDPSTSFNSIAAWNSSIRQFFSTLASPMSIKIFNLKYFNEFHFHCIEEREEDVLRRNEKRPHQSGEDF
ncbi:hypothetical protein H6P81_012556 [Aristolochia fimbriata]|uniref:Uncharacterized protein n=1 Tax=Aristolochia fimbriata TaxID=158543 RepID=A0AAV7ECF9_ARIFI|nr:hypothetical protein H6P81_012556 [Aristolochia fimbriata]